MNAHELGFKPVPSNPSCYYPQSTQWLDPWGNPAFKVEPDGPSHIDMKLELWAAQTALNLYRCEEARELAAKILAHRTEDKVA